MALFLATLIRLSVLHITTQDFRVSLKHPSNRILASFRIVYLLL
jgi:hypothetical protein